MHGRRSTRELGRVSKGEKRTGRGLFVSGATRSTRLVRRDTFDASRSTVRRNILRGGIRPVRHRSVRRGGPFEGCLRQGWSESGSKRVEEQPSFAASMAFEALGWNARRRFPSTSMFLSEIIQEANRFARSATRLATLSALLRIRGTRRHRRHVRRHFRSAVRDFSAGIARPSFEGPLVEDDGVARFRSIANRTSNFPRSILEKNDPSIRVARGVRRGVEKRKRIVVTAVVIQSR